MKSLRTCKCGTKATTEDELTLFVQGSKCKYGRTNLCKVCRATKKRETYTPKNGTLKLNHNYTHRDRYLYKKYKIREKDYDRMFAEQDGTCKICRCTTKSERNGYHKRLAVDHCHTTGEVRGLLCVKCNVGIGYFDDDIDVLKNAIKYLRG